MIHKTLNNVEHPQVIALKALAFLASDEDRLSGFLLASGLDLQDLKEQANDLNLLAGLLDHVLANENLLLEFADSMSCKPESVIRARQELPGASHDA
jgi:Protein of unknown function (DUF3572)